MKDLHISLLSDIYGGLLTEKQRDIVRDYFDYDLSLGEIAASYGISRQAVADTVKTCERSLCKYEETLGFAARLADIRAAIASVSDSLAHGDSVKAKADADALLSEL